MILKGWNAKVLTCLNTWVTIIHASQRSLYTLTPFSVSPSYEGTGLMSSWLYAKRR